MSYKYIKICFWLIWFFQLTGCSSSNKTKYISGNNNTVIQLNRELKAGEKHLYNIQLQKDEFAHIQAVQSGIDVIAKVTSANNNWQQIFDSPNGELDAENIYLLSNASGKYNIEIYSAQKYADPGDYSLKIIRAVRATEKDKKWMAALEATQKANKLRSKNETRQQSIQQYEAALKFLYIRHPGRNIKQ